MSRPAIIESADHMVVMVIDRTRRNLDILFEQLVNDCVAGDTLGWGIKIQRIPLHASLGLFVKLVMFARRRGALVIALHMNAMSA